MATPIKETPVLTGADAKRFLATKKKNEGAKENPKIKERIMKNYGKFKLADS